MEPDKVEQPKSSRVVKSKDPNENAVVLCLNSGDNLRADCIQNYVAEGFSKTIDYVSIH